MVSPASVESLMIATVLRPAAGSYGGLNYALTEANPTVLRIDDVSLIVDR
jgi:hypothetical protein